MSDFLYKAIDREGRTISGLIEARTLDYARKQLQKSYRHILELGPREDVRKATRGVSVQVLFVYTQQLAAMIYAGIPITRAVEMLSQGYNAKMNLVMEQVQRSLIAGRSLQSSMADYPQVFPRLYTSLVGTAEMSGRLHQVLTKLTQLLEREAALRKRLIATFTYPLALAFLATSVCALIVFYILPILRPMFSQIGMELPAMTLAMIRIADSLKHPLTWISALLGVCALGYGIFYIFRQGSSEPGGARWRFDAATLYIPVLGKLILQSSSARTLFAMALMLEAGMRLPDILRIVDPLSGNAYLSDKIRKARQTLTEGVMLVEALDTHDVFSRSALSMLRAGEESGRLDEMMRLVANTYEADLDLTLDRLSATLEPIVMGIMGVVVGFICIASLLPVLKFVQQI